MVIEVIELLPTRPGEYYPFLRGNYSITRALDQIAIPESFCEDIRDVIRNYLEEI